MTRDVPLFHLPLRQLWRTLSAATGELAQWNPMINGGQPTLSNPNYTVFYPPTWLGLALPVPYALGVLACLHAGWAFLGSYRLARILGCRSGVAALGATTFAASGWFVSLSSVFPFYCSAAWLPWVAGWGYQALHLEGGEEGAAIRWGAAAIALQFLAGEPMAVLMSAVLLAAMAAAEPREAPRRLRRLAGLVALAGALAAVQLLPTVARVADSPRASGLSYAEATEWSASPRRLVEVVWPHFFGDPNRDEEDLYFGWGLHDKGYPYVISLYSGLLVTVLGVASLVSVSRWPTAGALRLAALVGLGVGIGRHNPVYPWLFEWLPGLAGLRYPEKFLVLVVFAIGLAGVLAWQRLLVRREAGDRRPAELPLAIAVILVAAAVGMAAAFTVQPDIGRSLVRSGSGLPPSVEVVDKGLAFLRREAVVAAVVAAMAAGVLGAARWTSLSSRTLTVVAALVLCVDLGFYSRGFNAVLPASEVLPPPRLAQRLATVPGRVFTVAGLDAREEVSLRVGRLGFYQMTGRIRRLDPYVGVLWGVEYAANRDYDQMLTGWGRVTLAEVRRVAADEVALVRVLGAWNTSTILLRRGPAEMLADLRAGEREPALVRAHGNSALLPRFRFPPAAVFHRGAAEALEAVRRDRYEVGRREHCVSATLPPGSAVSFSPARVLASRERGGTVEVAYRAPEPALLVAAMTYHRGWSGSVGRVEVPLFPTALGQLAAVLPAGAQRLTLRFRDRWVRPGGALSAVALLGCLLAVLRRRHPAGQR